MTMVSDDSVGPAADQQPPDELEDWLTDLRINLSDDPPGWLTPMDDTTDPDPEPEPVASPATEDHAVPAIGTTAQPDQPDANLEDDRPAPRVGRHRAAE
jgi:hypothetical protein